MPTHGPFPDQPTCPRCGYDQSGAVAAWTDWCPVGGTCPECGDSFAWADLFDPGRRDLPWYAEHATGVLGVVRRTPRTLLRLARPARFWREVGVGARVRVGRLVWFLLFLGLGGYLFTAAAMFAGGYYEIATAPWRLRGGRLDAYSNDEVVTAAFEALLEPIVHVYAGGWGNASGALRVGTVHVMGWQVRWDQAMVLGAWLAWVLVLVVLPVTRASCKVRTAHAVRAAMLSLLAPMLSIGMMRVLMAANDVWAPSRLLHGLWQAMFLANLALTVWMLRWWWCAVRVGWRLRPALPILWLGTAAAILGACVLALLLDTRGILFTLRRL